MTKEPPPEVKAAIKSFVQAQREKYGENWKEILAKKMTRETVEAMTKAGLLKR